MHRKPKTEKERKEWLGRIVEQELEDAEGGDSDELQANREEAMLYYKGELPPPPTDSDGNLQAGRSAVVSMDVADSVTNMLAMMREMLITDAELVVEPEGPQDEALARAEADICSDVFLKDNPGERMLLSAIRDGLLMRNGVLKVRMQDGECRVEAVPVENVSYTAGWDGHFQELPFFSERIRYTRSDLIEMGLPKKEVMALNPHADYTTGTERARNAAHKSEYDGETEDQDMIDCHEAYCLTCMDGTGIAKRYRVLVADRRDVLEFEEVGVIPYAMGSPFLASHRLTGESIFDHVRQIQDSQTTMWRQWHDNVAANNNGRVVYDPTRVTEADIMNPIAGGGIRASDPAAVAPLVIPDMTGGIATAMDQNRRKRTEAIGASMDMASAEAQLANKAATVAAIEKGNQELVSAMVANNFALTLVKGVYALIRYHLRMFAERPYPARVSGQTVPVDPRMWPVTRRLTVRCGMSPSHKAQVQQALMMHMQNQAMAMQSGLDGILADANTVYKTSLRWLQMQGVQDPESLLIDPTSPQAEQARQAMQQQQQMAMQAEQAAVQQEQQMEHAKLMEEGRQHDEEIRFKYYDANLDAEMKEAQITGQGVIDLEKQRLTNESAERAAERAANSGANGNGDLAG